MAHLHIAGNAEQLHKEFENFIIKLSTSAVSDHGYFSIGFSGGSSATIVGKALAQNKDLQYDKWNVFFCDERFVDLTDPDSNYNALKASLFDKVAIPKNQIFTINAELTVQDAALDYASKLKSVFGEVDFPKFDLLVLGMGPDGHICSLFPNHPLLDEEKCWTASITDSPKPPPQRITLTLPILNHARNVCFTVMGASKADMVKNVIKNPFDKNIPASLVDATKGNVHWFMDNDAAKLLQ